MYKTVSLKELPNSYIAPGMSLKELSEYLGVSVEMVKEWEKFFNLFPELGAGVEEIYSRAKIEDFMKIKDLLDKGKSLKEIRRTLFNLPFESTINPFESVQCFSDLNFQQDVVVEQKDEELIVRPFLTQLNRANERIEELIAEKAKIVEDAALQKAELMTEIETLKTRNIELVSERESLLSTICEKEQLLKRASLQECALGEALKISQEMLKKKDEEMLQLKAKLDKYEVALQEKNSLIQNQSLEISRMLEKQNKKWWQFWKQ